MDPQVNSLLLLATELMRLMFYPGTASVTLPPRYSVDDSKILLYKNVTTNVLLRQRGAEVIRSRHDAPVTYSRDGAC